MSVSRRNFVKTAATATAALSFPTIIPRHVLGGANFVAPSEKVNVGIVGCGLGGTALDRTSWRASTLFARYARVSPRKAWQHSFTLREIPTGSYLAIALNGEHGSEGAPGGRTEGIAPRAEEPSGSAAIDHAASPCLRFSRERRIRLRT